MLACCPLAACAEVQELSPVKGSPQSHLARLVQHGAIITDTWLIELISGGSDSSSRTIIAIILIFIQFSH